MTPDKEKVEDELATLRARVRELEASIAAHFAKVHGPESITACEAVTRLGEYAALGVDHRNCVHRHKLQEAEKERDDYHKKACDIADERDTLRARLQEAEKLSGERQTLANTEQRWRMETEAKLAQQAEALRAIATRCSFPVWKDGDNTKPEPCGWCKSCIAAAALKD